MKTNNEVKNNIEQSSSLTTQVAFEFGEMVVYNEMLEQTSVKVNLVEQIHSQLNQLEELNAKRNFLSKEVYKLICD